MNTGKSFSVTLTYEQAQAILQLIDLAVKAQGLPIAAAAAAIHQHLDAAYKAANPEETK